MRISEGIRDIATAFGGVLTVSMASLQYHQHLKLNPPKGLIEGLVGLAGTIITMVLSAFAKGFLTVKDMIAERKSPDYWPEETFTTYYTWCVILLILVWLPTFWAYIRPESWEKIDATSLLAACFISSKKRVSPEDIEHAKLAADLENADNEIQRLSERIRNLEDLQS